jgi:CHAD domain-containing protein
MAKDPKWVIDGLTEELKLNDIVKSILGNRLSSLLELTKQYLSDSSVKNLHDLRIGIRRFRYSMELFFRVFERKKFLSFYNRIEHLQELTGQIRDLDVFESNILNLSGNSKRNKYTALKKQVMIKRQGLTDELKLELMKFIHGKQVKNFIKNLSIKE